MTAYGYIRKSVMADPAKTLSPQVQRERIFALATAHGDDLTADTMLEDLDRSGALVEERRQYMRLVDAIEAGDATSVYAYDLSRLHRNTQEALRFFKLCKARSVPVRLVTDSIDTGSATGWAVLTILSAVNTMISEVASEKIKASLAYKHASTGYRHGARPYGEKEGEDASIVLDAFRAAGSFDGAARRLNAQGIRCRVQGANWSGSVVAGIVRRVAPDEVGPSVRRKVPAGRRRFRFSGILVCGTCGHVMTGSTDARSAVVRYQCAQARTTPHARGWVSESKLLSGIEAEVEHARLAIKRLQVGSAEDESRVAEIDAERARVKAMFRKAYMSEQELDEAMTELAKAESRLQTRRWIKRIALPPNVSTADPGSTNAYLRGIFDRVEVDMSERATRGPSSWQPNLSFTWRDQTLRVA